MNEEEEELTWLIQFMSIELAEILVHMDYNFVNIFIISIFFLLYMYSSFFFLSFRFVYMYGKIRDIAVVDVE